MIDPVAMIALTRPDVQRQIVETYLAGFEAGYDLGVDPARAQNASAVVRACRDGQGLGRPGDNRRSDVLRRFSNDRSEDGGTA